MPVAGTGADGLAGPISVQSPVPRSARPCRMLPGVAGNQDTVTFPPETVAVRVTFGGGWI